VSAVEEVEDPVTVHVGDCVQEREVHMGADVGEDGDVVPEEEDSKRRRRRRGRQRVRRRLRRR
jgi:hypothetical protein